MINQLWQTLSSVGSYIGFQQPPSSTKILCDKIKGIDALQIELISRRMASSIAENLGRNAVMRIDNEVSQKQPKSSDRTQDLLSLFTIFDALQAGVNGEKELLPPSKKNQFINGLLKPIQQELEQSFSRPQDFLEHGLIIRLSDYEPDQILLDIAQSLNIQIKREHVPPKYYISLKLNKELSQEKSTLVFCMKETSRDVEFAATNFTFEGDLETS